VLCFRVLGSSVSVTILQRVMRACMLLSWALRRMRMRLLCMGRMGRCVCVCVYVFVCVRARACVYVFVRVSSSHHSSSYGHLHHPSQIHSAPPHSSPQPTPLPLPQTFSVCDELSLNNQAVRARLQQLHPDMQVCGGGGGGGDGGWGASRCVCSAAAFMLELKSPVLCMSHATMATATFCFVAIE